MSEVEEIVGYLYIKNGKIMGSDKTGKNKSFGTPIKITLPGYYRMVNGTPKLILAEGDLLPGDVFVGNRDWKQYREKRQKATGGDKPDDTRVHDELKEESSEENNTDEEQG